MAYNYNFIKTNLNYETETPYIKGGNIWKYSNSRFWFFTIQDSLTVVKGAATGWSKYAFYLPPEGTTSTTARLRMISDLDTADSQSWNANGTASLQDTGFPDTPPSPVWENKNWAVQTYPFYVQDIGTSQKSISAEFETNIPVFSDYNTALGYINGTVPIESALNYLTHEEPQSTLFEIYNTAQKDLWSLTGKEFISGPYYRWARVKVATSNIVDGRIAFYRQGLTGDSIKLIPVIGGEIVSCEYSTNGGADWQTSNSFPFEYIYGERIDELGEFISATRSGIDGDSGVPVFETLAEATGWINHDPTIDISNALNYESMTNRYGITNNTGAAETSTTMGTASNFKSHFTQKYILDSGEVTKICNAFFDTTTNIFEDIKKGLEMMGASIVDAICGITFWPVDLTNVFTRISSQSYIFFGGYQWPPTGDPTSITVYKLTGYDGYLSLGTFTIEKSFPGNDYRNYEPYCNVSIYLPYIGLQKLSYNKYVGKTTEVRYYLDINSGGVLACLLCDGKLLDYFNGQMGVEIPITVTNYAEFAGAELKNISNLAGVGGNSLGAITAGASGNIMGAAVAGAGAVGNFEKSMYDLQTTNINNFNTTKGGSGAIGNQYLPQYVYLIFEYIKTEESGNLIQLAGRASNASGNLGSFSGYLEVDEVELRTTAGMTEAEKNNFISLLHSGIII